MAAHVAINIRLLTKEDLRDIHRFVRRPEVLRGTLQIPSLSIGQMASRWMGESEGRFTLVAELAQVPSRGRVIGAISLQRGSGRRAHVAGLGMMVDPDFHGQRVGTRMMEAALEMAERYWRPIRIELEVYPDNEPAVRLYRRFGFEAEGRKSHVAIREGRYADTLVMSRLSPPSPARLQEACGGETEAAGVTREVSCGGQAASAGQLLLDVRPPEPGDAAALHRFCCDERVLRNSSFLPWTVPSAEKTSSEFEVDPIATGHRFIATASGEVYGDATLQPGRGRLAQTGTVALMALPPESLGSRGEDTPGASESISRALLTAIVDLADDWLLLHRLELETYPDERSLFPALEEAGFAREATARMASLRDGVYEGRLVWGRIRQCRGGQRLPEQLCRHDEPMDVPDRDGGASTNGHSLQIVEPA